MSVDIATSNYEELLKSIEDSKCQTCLGRGTVNDAEPGDISYNIKGCNDCHGSGFNRGNSPVDPIINSYDVAINFAIDELCVDDAETFLIDWREGNWKSIRDNFPEFNLETTGECDKDDNLLPMVNLGKIDQTNKEE